MPTSFFIGVIYYVFNVIILNKAEAPGSPPAASLPLNQLNQYINNQHFALNYVVKKPVSPESEKVFPSNFSYHRNMK
jgi:hypothetical protein